MSLTLWILLILAIIYLLIYLWVWTSPKAKEYGLVKYGPLIMIKTKFGIKIMDRLCVYTRFWRFFGVFSNIVSLFLMVMIIMFLVIGVINLPNSLQASGVGVEYALAIPGLNPLLPLWFGIIGLVIAMVLHELAHGFQTRSNGMRVDSTGLLYGVVPLGAFVEPNEEDVKKASRRVKLDLYSAGISMNFIIGVIAFLLVAVVMLGGISSPYGDNGAVYSITSGSPADQSDFDSGAIILTVDGQEFYYVDDYEYSWEPGELVSVVYEMSNSTVTKDIRWGLYIEAVNADTPAYVAGIPDGSFLLNATIDGVTTNLYGYDSFTEFMSTTHSGQTVTFQCLSAEGEDLGYYEVVLTSNGSIGFVGIVTSTSGMYFTTPNLILDAARNPFYGAETVSDYVLGFVQYLSGPFDGFDPLPVSTEWWYDVPFESVFWILASMIYWIFWLNIMLGISNAIPAYPFDGGYIFKGWLNGLLEKLRYKDEEAREQVTESVMGSLSTLMIFVLFIVVIAVIL